MAKVFACGAGLTIEHIRAGRAPATFPRIIGHEISAEIVDVGQGVSEFASAIRSPAISTPPAATAAGAARTAQTICRNQGPRVGYQIDGGYAELIKLPAHNFLKLPPGS